MTMLLEQPLPAIVLSDVQMPGELNGTTLRRKVLEHFPGLPVLLMTGHSSEDLDPGTPVLRKPFRVNELLEAIRENE